VKSGSFAFNSRPSSSLFHQPPKNDYARLQLRATQHGQPDQEAACLPAVLARPDALRVQKGRLPELRTAQRERAGRVDGSMSTTLSPYNALQMKGDKERVLECTTSAFDGLIAMVNPQDSWVVGAFHGGCGR
jgi:hypothetical protein